MAKLPLAIDDPKYTALLCEHARDIGALLADSLLENGVSKEKAYTIVGSFLFDYAMMSDFGGRYKVAGRYKPRLALDNGLGQLVIPTEDTYLHELTHDLVEEIFNVPGRR